MALLALVLPLTLSGYATYNEWGGEWLEEVHEFVGEFFLWTVLAHLSGMRVPRLQRLGFVIACGLSGLAACAVLALEGQVTPMFGMWMLMKGLAAAMIGGLGSVRGVLLGAALLGVAESHAQAAFGAIGRDAATWGLLLLALLLRTRQAAPEPSGGLHA